MANKNISNLTEIQAKKLLNDIADTFNIGSDARTPSVILINVKNSANDQFCRHKRIIEYLEGKTFRLIKNSSGYVFTRPGAKPDFSGQTISEVIEKAINHEEED